MTLASSGFCLHCGGPLRSGASYCTRCGAFVKPVCAACRTPLRTEARYCTCCGTAVNAAALPDNGGTCGSATQAEELLAVIRSATLGEYEIVGELGRGGMATVYLAHDIALDRKVAIKVLSLVAMRDAGLAERFLREARTAAALGHPHIVPVYHVRQTESVFFIVMKFVAGRALDTILGQVGPLPVAMTQMLVLETAAALGYAHDHGVVHRDVKPANILLDENGSAMVTDFGMAKIANAKELTRAGATVGTPRYMSPEQFAGGPVTSATDQYALGAVAYEMLTGRAPFCGKSALDLGQAHLHEVPAPISSLRPDCPAVLEAGVMRMLAKDPGDRWCSMEALGAELHRGPFGGLKGVRQEIASLAGRQSRHHPQVSTPRSPAPGSATRQGGPESPGRPS